MIKASLVSIVGLLLIAASQTHAATPAHSPVHHSAPSHKPEPQYTIGPAPAWVVPMPDSGPAADGAPGPASAVRVVLLDRQIRIGDAKEGYIHLKLRLLNAAGVAELSQLQIPYDPQRDKLRIHDVVLRRGTEVINELKSGRIEILQREHGLEEQVLNGALTFHLLLNDVRVGDTIDYSYTIEHTAPVWGNRFFAEYTTRWNEPIDSARLRVLRREGSPLYIKNHDGAQPTEQTLGGWRTLQWLWRNVLPLLPDADTPQWYDMYPSIELSQFASWHELAEAAVPLYDTSNTPSPEMASQIDKLRSAGTTDADRALATVRFVQEEVRYTGIEKGDGAYRPTAPDIVLKRRFGDCKDKTLLAVMLLRALGIDAAPVLVSTRWRHALASRLPSPGAMNHAIVRVHIGNAVYWFDVTATAQGGDLIHFSQAALGAGLVVTSGVSAPETIPNRPSEHALIDAKSTFDLRQGLDQEADLLVATHYRGEAADQLRRQLRTTTTDELEKWYLNYYKGRYPGIHSHYKPLIHDDLAANEMTVTESYGIDHPFIPGDAGAQHFELHTSVITDQLKPPNAPVRTMPLALTYPTDTAEQVDVRMPYDWTVKDDAEQFDGPGFTYESHVHALGPDVHLEYHYRSLKDHVPPEQMTDFLKKRDQARSDTYFSFTLRLPTPSTAAELTKAVAELQKAATLAQNSSVEKADQVLTKLIGSNVFGNMSPEQQHITLLLSGTLALQRSEYARAQRLLMQSSTKAQADASDWQMRLSAAYSTQDATDATRSLTTLAERWPGELHDVDDDVVARTYKDTPSTGSSDYALLKALFAAHYERQDGLDLTDWWRDLGLLQIAHGDRADAVSTLQHVHEVYALISIRADNRFATTRADLGDALDIAAAAKRHIEELRAAEKKEPSKLLPILQLTEALCDSQRLDEALSIADSAVARVREAPGSKSYSDYEERFVWLLNTRATVLQELGRWDDAVTQLEEASHLSEHNGINVSQTINLAGLYNDLGRAREARVALARLGDAPTSPYGAMQVAMEQLNSAELLDDAAVAERQLAYLREHQNDSCGTYQRALISANRLDEAAELLRSRLNDPEQRLDALMDVQSYVHTPHASRAEVLLQRWQAVLARPEVQQAILAVGTLEAYPVRARAY